MSLFDRFMFAVLPYFRWMNSKSDNVVALVLSLPIGAMILVMALVDSKWISVPVAVLFAFLTLYLLVMHVIAMMMDFKSEFVVRHTGDMNAIYNLHWKAFEELVAAIYGVKGYAVISCDDNKADGGVDLYARKNGKIKIIQCKKYSTDDIGVHKVRELYGVMNAEEADAAAFVTTTDFTPASREFCQGKPIELIDKKALMEMLAETRGEIEKEETAFGKWIEELAKKFQPDFPERICNRCGAELHVREKKGDHFWGCSQYGKTGCAGTYPFTESEKRIVANVRTSVGTKVVKLGKSG